MTSARDTLVKIERYIEAIRSPEDEEEDEEGSVPPSMLNSMAFSSFSGCNQHEGSVSAGPLDQGNNWDVPYQLPMHGTHPQGPEESGARGSVEQYGAGQACQ